MRVRRAAAAVVAASIPNHAGCQQYADEQPSRYLAVLNSDEYAESSLVLTSPGRRGLGISESDHKHITQTLATTQEMTERARSLLQNEKTMVEGRELMMHATAMFRQVKEHIMQSQSGQEERTLNQRLGQKYADHDLNKVKEDETRALDISRRVYEMMYTFPECLECTLERCQEIINADLEALGLATIEFIIHEKRNENQDNYNKVVIVTNDLADRVMGKDGDGIVEYPFLWHDTTDGHRMLGVDGKWNCQAYTPVDCCNMIKESCPDQDVKGNYIECHIFVPYGGVGNPKKEDRVIINLSPDGYVHEVPVIA